MPSVTFFIKRFSAIVLLTLIYGVTIFLSIVSGFFVKSKNNSRKVIINGTFHNPNWFFSHIDPLVKSGYGETILVCDEPVERIERLTYACPPQWACKIFSRAIAKALWTLINGYKSKANIFIGYHIFPSAITALVCAKLLKGKAVYQVTSGQLELEGGGWHAENRLLASLGKPSPWIEKLVHGVVKKFDLIVVRGSKAENYILKTGYSGDIEKITGSVKIFPETHEERNIDVIFVGRLTECKRLDRLLNTINKVLNSLPHINVVLLGDGPEKQKLQLQAKKMGLDGNIFFMGKRRDVPYWMNKAKTFVLTSRSEGVSIAMLEAMGMGVVPVVTDVGDLGDFVFHGKTGFICQEHDTGAMAHHIVELLKNAEKRLSMAKAAKMLVTIHAERSILSNRWGKVLDKVGRSKEGKTPPQLLKYHFTDDVKQT